MLNCFQKRNDKTKNKAIPIYPIITKHFSQWLKSQDHLIKNWLQNNKFTAQPNTWCVVPDENHEIRQVVVGIDPENDPWTLGALPIVLPEATYFIEGILDKAFLSQSVLAWGLGAYQFNRYRTRRQSIAKLILPDMINQDDVIRMIEATYWVRDLINTPTEDMGPSQLAHAANGLAKEYSATVSHIIGDDLLKKNFPAIHTVGRASDDPPRLIDLQWGKKTAPKITLVGKGVCFDSGGLDIKNALNMALMKKDMGGAAHALGFAKLIMEAKLPVRLRVLIPAVENVISGNAYRPGDIITMRNGMTVEIGNTDAEGRLVLADALTEACSDEPELLIDFATLTGAARVAVGTDIAAMFTNRDELAIDLFTHSKNENDPIWRLPLYAPYRKLIESPIADINNSGNSGYAGAITAALFLKEFIVPTVPWIHFDIMAWNLVPRPGRPDGGEAMTLRALFRMLLQIFHSSNKI